jgi:glyoxylase-like metal-dependent hydrolase (beta-lactamase superfamily II)
LLLKAALPCALLEVGRCRHLEAVALSGGRFKIVDFPALVVLIKHPSRGPILFDTGYADHFLEETQSFPERLYRLTTPPILPPEERLENQLRRHGVSPDDVELVLVSHLHADHVAGLRDLPRARFLLLRKEFEAFRHLRGFAAVRRGFLPRLLPDGFEQRSSFAEDLPPAELGPAWAPFERGYDLLGDGSLIGLPLPGHTPGQLGVLLRAGDGRPLLLAADACWSARAWREQRPPAFLARLLMSDWSDYLRQLAALKYLAVRQPELHILPSHCQQTIGELRGSLGAPSWG